MDIADRRGLTLRSPRVAVVAVCSIISIALLIVALIAPPVGAPAVPTWVLVGMSACSWAVAVLSIGFVDAERWVVGITLAVLLMTYPPLFAVASLEPHTVAAVVIATAAAWWHIPLLLLSQVLVLMSVARVTGVSTRRSTVVISALAAVSLALVLGAGPAPESRIEWFIDPQSPVGETMRLLSVASLPVWLGSLMVTPVTAWWRAAHIARADRARAVIVAVAAVTPLILVLVCGVLVVVTTLDGVPKGLSYPILGMGLPVAILASVLLIRAPDDRRLRLAAMIAACATAVLVSVAVAVVSAVIVAPSGTTVSTLVALLVFISLSGAFVPAELWVYRVLAAVQNVDPAVAPTPSSPPDSARFATLTPREREVLELLAEGLSNAGIARRLTTSPRTIDAHVRSVFQKLGTTADPDANQRVRAALRWVVSVSEVQETQVR